MKAGSKKSTRTMRGFPQHRLYVGLFTALAALAADFPAQAQQAQVASIAAQQYSIAAGELGDALNQLATQSQMQIVYAPELVQGKSAPAISGHLTWRQALDRLLAGSGLEYSLVTQSTVAIRRAEPQPHTAPSSPGTILHPAPVPAPAAASKPTALQSITVLGSLLPRSQVETSSPLIVISAQEIKDRGFSSVADALQNLAINTGARNNTSVNAGDVWAAKTVSLFGLDPSYTKFLINGRPMPMFSQTAVGATADQLYTNLSGIPIDLVERIEVLPGGQSSLYGSDAIAGVINIVLKKHAQVGTIDARYGAYSDGGGRERSLSASNSFEIGKLNLMVGVQLHDQQPMWDFQRGITAQNFAGGMNSQQAGTDALAYGFSGVTYFPASSSDCNKLSGLWRGSERYYATPYSAYCGSVSDSAFKTLINEEQGASLSLHADYDVNENVHLYADFLDTYEKQAHTTTPFYFALFNDPNLHDDVEIIRNFAPEEMANNLDGLLTQKNYENTYTGTVGGKIDFANSWNLDVGFTRAYERDDNRQTGLLAAGVAGSFGSALLGPQLGTDAFGYPIYSPNYSLLTNPITPAQYASFVGSASIASTDRNDQLRAQLTQASLFSLPGGDAGLAILAEDGFESWKYLPSPLLTSGDLDGTKFNPSDGHRNRYATAAELNLPLFQMLTADLSARYDSYNAEGAHFSKPTYSVGLEFRPVDGLLLRGRYSTSFKAPSLIDEFEGSSAGQAYVVDYVNCARLGFTGGAVGNCPIQYTSQPVSLERTSNPNLQPMTAKSFSYGVVWSPTANLSMNVDYQHISIRNEVLQESATYVMQTELYCADGTLDPQSPTCQAINGQIIRAAATPGSPLLGRVLQVMASKINLARELNNSLIAGFNYRFNPGALGRFGLGFDWTRVLNHQQQRFPGDPLIDFLNNPGYSTEFKTKANAHLDWSLGKWSATLYGSYFGPTPNYIAYLNNSYDVPNAGKVAAWRIYNLSVSYSPVPAWQLSLRINNIKNSMPPIDVTQPGSTNMPFVAGNYNPFGREVMMEARYQFGAGKNY